ncbi:hypothetical protein C8E03_10796 [Lachnotalea glycerini]|uniref:XRE family transcriptional regulator n=1 Tax=Lachnotalea glycerini TaxID=1763509 RepID=A0A255I8E7_9FIRM|nr:hypothetical protein [Lachnotalea glycerini]PXV89119.1 hypothetical protein C8E03_10796 [Lachnotalea glycerini]RDY29527.1 hypothetical protein CG710_018440 [Lachnotalea glycerini]
MLDNPRDRFIKLEAIRVKYGLSKEQMTNFLGLDNVAAYEDKINKKYPFTYDELLIIKATFNLKAERRGEKLYTVDDIFLD